MFAATGLPGPVRTATVAVHPARLRQLPVDEAVVAPGWLRRRMMPLSRRRPVAIPRPVLPAAPSGDLVSPTTGSLSLAVAVRRQLTNPGSVSPERQLQLIIADRVADDNRLRAARPAEYRWTPFMKSVEVNPYRPIDTGGAATPDRSGRQDPWWGRPFEDLNHPSHTEPT